MVGDDGEHTRFPCLAKVRTLVATVVTVLAVAVVVLVIVVVDRPEDISLSLSRGYIQSEQLWYTETQTTVLVTTPSRTASNAVTIEQSPFVDLDPLDRGGLLPEVGDSGEEPSGDVSGQKRFINVTKYAVATQPVNLQITWSAYNPSGRGLIQCDVTAIRVLDMPNASSTGMEIGRIFSKENPLHFSVPPQASHTEMHRVTISDTHTLQYIYEKYGEQSSFSAMLQVTATSTFKPTLSSARDHSVNYSCSPVTVVHGTPDDTAYGKVTCTMEYPVPISSPAPAPAPAPGG